MRAVNLYYLSGISNERLFSDYENILSARNGVTRIRRADQAAHGVGHPRRWSFRRMVTVVPRPGMERTRSLSMKPSMMVKAMPLRSSPPVV